MFWQVYLPSYTVIIDIWCARKAIIISLSCTVEKDIATYDKKDKGPQNHFMLMDAGFIVGFQSDKRKVASTCNRVHILMAA